MNRMKKILAMVLALIFCFGCISVNGAVAGENASFDLQYDFQVLNVEVIANKITVSGIAGVAAKTVVGLYMTEGDEVVYVKQVMTEADGTFEAEMVLDPAKYNADNKGTLIVGGMNTNSRKITDIELYSQTELDDCVGAFVNGIADADDFEAFFAEYGEMLGVTGDYTDAEMEVLYNEYVNNHPSDVSSCDAVIAAIQSLCEVVDTYKDFFRLMNEAAATGDGAQMKRLMTVTYKDIVAFETEFVLIQNESGVYSKMAAAYTDEYVTMDDIEDAFMAAVEAQRDEEAVNGYITDHKSKGFVDEAWRIDVRANTIKISGKTDDAGVHNIVFYVTDYNVSGANILSLYQTKTEKDGSFTAEFALEASVYGDENMGMVKVSGADRNVYQFIIPLYGEEELNSMANDFTAISDEDDMADFLENYGEMLNIGEGYGSDKVKLLAELCGENDYSDLEYSEEVVNEVVAIDEAMYVVKDFVDSINKFSSKNQQSHIRDAIEVKNADLAEMSKSFAELREASLGNTKVSKKGIYMRLIGQTFECVGDILDAYNEAFEEQKRFEETENTATSRPSSGGGGGGGGFSAIEIAPELIPVPEVEELEPEKAPVEGFKDIEGYDWAKDAINGLRNLSIVRGDGSGNYRPGDEVTREEFLSMLLATFYVETAAGEVPFADVDKNAWYADVVATAYELGITKGMGDGTFGIGQEILRSDMVVFAARLADAKGVVIKKGNEAKIFTDFPEIPSYAYDNVVSFQQAGLVNGDETGKFNPRNKLTRAEAAVFFWNIFNFIERQI